MKTFCLPSMVFNEGNKLSRDYVSTLQIFIFLEFRIFANIFFHGWILDLRMWPFHPLNQFGEV